MYHCWKKNSVHTFFLDLRGSSRSVQYRFTLLQSEFSTIVWVILHYKNRNQMLKFSFSTVVLLFFLKKFLFRSLDLFVSYWNSTGFTVVLRSIWFHSGCVADCIDGASFILSVCDVRLKVRASGIFVIFSFWAVQMFIGPAHSIVVIFFPF